MTIDLIPVDWFSGERNIIHDPDSQRQLAELIREIQASINTLTDDASTKRFRFVPASDSLVLATDEVLIVTTNGGDVDIQLPDSAGLPTDGLLREYWIHHIRGPNKCAIVGPFQDGLARLEVPKGKTVHLGAVGGPTPPQNWLRISLVDVVTKARRTSNIAPATFAVPYAIPFEVADLNDNPLVLNCDVAGPNPERVTCGHEHRYDVSFIVECESTGLGLNTYNLACDVHLNGAPVPGMHIVTGNNRNRECNASLPATPIDLVPTDRLELVVQQNGLGTGGITGAWLQVRAKI